MDISKIKNNVLKYGLMLGIVSGVLTLGIYAIDASMMVKWWYGMIALALTILILIFACTDFRKQNEGLASFKDLFFMIIGICVVSSTISTIIGMLLFQIIDPELGSRLNSEIINQTVEMMEKFNTPDDIIDKTVADMESKDNFSVTAQLRSWLLGSLIGGIIFGLIFGAIFKKKAPEMI